VPSPTFTLVQTYDFARLSIAHFDLYRLGSEDELDEIGFDEAIRSGAALIEWPERAGGALPAGVADFCLDPGPDVDARTLRIAGPAGFMQRLDRTRRIRSFLESAGWGLSARRFLKADASTRSLERLHLGDATRILMNHPPETTDAAGLARKAARSSAKLAEDIRAFVAVGTSLHAAGFAAPEIFATDRDAGFALMEDFGHTFIAEDGAPIPERYRAAVDVLIALHARDWPTQVSISATETFALPAYDQADLLTMLDPFLDWELPRLLGRAASADERAGFRAAWAPVLADVCAGPKTWALRDYHSPNLMWLADRVGIQRVGLLDFQDAVVLHPAYDLASLAQDARVTVPPELEQHLVTHYLPGAGSRIDAEAFRRAYAILAAQRATRILGVFTRLAERDGREDYLQHVPRMRAYLARALAAPALEAVKTWFLRHVPVAIVTVT
jgi:aminoglycoside/choline kinase family phosphotransferase